VKGWWGVASRFVVVDAAVLGRHLRCEPLKESPLTGFGLVDLTSGIQIIGVIGIHIARASATAGQALSWHLGPFGG